MVYRYLLPEGKTHDQEAAVQWTFQFKRISFFLIFQH